MLRLSTLSGEEWTKQRLGHYLTEGASLNPKYFPLFREALRLGRGTFYKEIEKYFDPK